METPLHAGDDVDKDENVPRIIAVIAGIAIAAVVAFGLVYSGLWSPPSTAAKTAATTTAPTHP